LKLNKLKMAEGVGFEPTDGLPHLLISSQVPLTTQPPFQPLVYRLFIRFCGMPFFHCTPPLHPVDSTYATTTGYQDKPTET
jgi:hypothetical protein